MQRCKAKSKRSGEQCKNYAIKNWSVCRMHGARGGPKTKEGIIKCTMMPFQHGLYSVRVQQEIQLLRKLIKD